MLCSVSNCKDATCYLNPYDREKTEEHWAPNRCYTEGKALFEVDVRRLEALGAITSVRLPVPRRLFDREARLHLADFAAWLPTALPAALHVKRLRHALYLQAPEFGSTSSGTRSTRFARPGHRVTSEEGTLAELWSEGPELEGWVDRLRQQAAVCGGDGRGGVLMGGHENMTGGLCAYHTR